MINDHTDAEIARRAHDYEMGGMSAAEQNWSKFYDACEAAIIRRGYGESLDGSEDVDGFSIDSAHDAFQRGHTVEEYMEVVDADRYRLRLPVTETRPALTNSIEWPNGEGFTPCSDRYRKIMDERDAICDLQNGGIVDNLPLDQYNRWHMLNMYLDTLQLQGHVGQGEKI